MMNVKVGKLKLNIMEKSFTPREKTLLIKMVKAKIYPLENEAKKGHKLSDMQTTRLFELLSLLNNIQQLKTS